MIYVVYKINAMKKYFVKQVFLVFMLSCFVSCTNDEVLYDVSKANVIKDDIESLKKVTTSFRVKQVDAILKEYQLDGIVNYQTIIPEEKLTFDEENSLRIYCESVKKYMDISIFGHGNIDYQYEADERGGMWIGRRTSSAPWMTELLCAVSRTINGSALSDVITAFTPNLQNTWYTPDEVTRDWSEPYPIQWRESGFLYDSAGIFIAVVYIGGQFAEKSTSGPTGEAICNIDIIGLGG